MDSGLNQTGTEQDKPRSFSAEHWRALNAIRNEYSLFTKLMTAALILAAVWNIYWAATENKGLSILPRWLQAGMASDGMLTILTAIIALAVGVHLKVRGSRGLLDGSEHYDIGRALAYGYFVNFLVPALLLVRDTNTRPGRSGPPLKFWVVFPARVEDLDTFKQQVEPLIRERTKAISLEGVYKTGAAVIKRSLMVVSRVQPGAAGGADELFFDFPTTLYTMHDYYAMWKDWQEEHKGIKMSDALMLEDEQQQLDAFFNKLGKLSKSAAGWKAVNHLGIDSPATLEALFADYFERVPPQELLQKLS